MTSVVVHRRQFVLGPAPFRDLPGWQAQPLDGGLWLSHCPQLRVDWAQSADGERWALLGLAVQTLRDQPDPLTAIATAPDSTVVSARYASWAGRWALVGGHRLHLDASGLLGVYYGRSAANGARPTPFWLSSSPALLSAILAKNHDHGRDTGSRRLRYGVGLSWHPPPRSSLAGIRRLLPSQRLHLLSGAPEPRPLLGPLPCDTCYSAVLDQLLDSFVIGLQRLPKAEPLWLSLSAGGDSRLLLAAAHRAGIAYRSFTRIAGRMSLADYLLPPRLVDELGGTHCYLTPRRRLSGHRLPGRSALAVAHSANQVSAGDAEPFVQGVRDELTGISIGGQGFGVGKLPLRRLPAEISDPPRDAERLARALGESHPDAVAGLAEWLNWVRQTPEPGLDWRDRFYLEQRMGGWQSAKEQLYDMNRHERFFPLNAARSHALLLSLDVTKRTAIRYQRDIIERTAPGLLNYPINPPDTAFGWGRALWLKSRQDPLYLARKLHALLRKRST